MLCAVATLRLLNALLDDVKTVNRIAAALTHDKPIDLPAPTNHPRGWEIHRRAFRALAAHDSAAVAAVRLADDYAAEERARDRDVLALRIPDLSTGAPRGEDVLAGLEWNREVRYWFAELDARGDRVVIDCRDLDLASWTEDAQHAIKRGIAQLATNAILFVEQDAGQDAHEWPGIGDVDIPILTHYLDGQSNWLRRCHAMPTWIAVYSPPGRCDSRRVYSRPFSRTLRMISPSGAGACPRRMPTCSVWTTASRDSSQASIADRGRAPPKTTAAVPTAPATRASYG